MTDLQRHPPSPSPNPGACLITLPHGAITGGITTWAKRLAAGLAERGWRICLLLGTGPPSCDAGTLGDLSSHPHIRVVPGDAHTPEAVAREAAALAALRNSPVVALPTYTSASFAAVAGATQRLPGVIRTVGVVHSDIAYDRLNTAAHEPLLTGVVAVSRDIAHGLQAFIPAASQRIEHIPYGVSVPASPPRRQSAVGRPLRAVYTGRFENHQKRVAALVEAQRQLQARGVPLELTLVGSGPLLAQLQDAAACSPGLRVVTPDPHLGSDGVVEHLDQADLLLLPSRFEGLSLSMLEAMARGCVPVVTRVSGAEEALAGLPPAGVIVDAPPGMDDHAVGAALADGVLRAISLGVETLGQAAFDRARARFADTLMVDASAALFSRVTTQPPRDWPTDRPLVPEDFTVPADACERTARALASLHGAKVALWGAGRHTRAVLRPALKSGARIVAIMDDAPDPAGASIESLPVVGAKQLPALGVTDVVISSALHEDDLWGRRAELESIGLRVHRVYA